MKWLGLPFILISIAVCIASGSEAIAVVQPATSLIQQERDGQPTQRGRANVRNEPHANLPMLPPSRYQPESNYRLQGNRQTNLALVGHRTTTAYNGQFESTESNQTSGGFAEAVSLAPVPQLGNGIHRTSETHQDNQPNPSEASYARVIPPTEFYPPKDLPYQGLSTSQLKGQAYQQPHGGALEGGALKGQASVGEAGYGTNPYAKTTPHATAGFVARGADSQQSNFARVSYAESGQESTSSSWGYPQDQVPDNRVAAVGFPRPLDSTQDPEDLDGGNQDAANQQNNGRQDTEPRPLPDNNRPPTQLPIPPADNDRTPFVHPEDAVPGRQTYPGATAPYANRRRPRAEVPTNPDEVHYHSQDRNQTFRPDGFPPYPDQRPWYPGATPNSYPQVQQGPSYLPYPPEPYPQGYESYARGYECRPPSGWRPQMVLGECETIDESVYDSCFSPLFYLSVFGGLNDQDDLIGATPTATQPGNSFFMDDGAGFGIAVGQFQGANLRTEIEYSFRQGDVESMQLGQIGAGGLQLSNFNLGGELNAHSGMGNAIWQFSHLGSRWVKPYVGAGIGFVFFDAEFNQLGQNVLTAGQEGNSSFAYQFFAGINTQLSERMDVFVEYRHFSADELRLETNLLNVNGSGAVIDNQFDFEANNLFFGLRYKF